MPLRIQRGLRKLRRALGRRAAELALLTVAIVAIERRAAAMPADFAARIAQNIAGAAPGAKAGFIAQAAAKGMRMAQVKVAAVFTAAAIAAGVIGGAALVMAEEKPASAAGTAAASTELPSAPVVRKTLEELFARRVQAAGAMTGEIEMEELPSDPGDLAAPT